MEKQNQIDLRLALFAVILLLTALSISVVLFFFFYKRRLYKKQSQLLKMEAQHKEDLLFSSITSTEIERKRIAADIHDELGSIFVTLSYSLNKLENEDLHSARIDTMDSRSLIEKGIASVRRISHAIMPPELELYGLLFTIENFCKKLSAADIGLSADFNFSPETFDVPSVMALPLYRILQELSSNTLKHAAATTVFVELIKDEMQYIFNYSDNGKGFEIKQMQAKMGLGFKNIESRVRMIKGSVSYTVSPGNGFFCQIIVPYS